MLALVALASAQPAAAALFWMCVVTAAGLRDAPPPPVTYNVHTPGRAPPKPKRTLEPQELQRLVDGVAAQDLAQLVRKELLKRRSSSNNALGGGPEEEEAGEEKPKPRGNLLVHQSASN